MEYSKMVTCIELHSFSADNLCGALQQLQESHKESGMGRSRRCLCFQIPIEGLRVLWPSLYRVRLHGIGCAAEALLHRACCTWAHQSEVQAAGTAQQAAWERRISVGYHSSFRLSGKL